MIQAKENEVWVKGTTERILAEATSLLHVIYKELVKEQGEKKANFLFAEMGKIAVNGFEIIEELNDTLEERVKEELKK